MVCNNFKTQYICYQFPLNVPQILCSIEQYGKLPTSTTILSSFNIESSSDAALAQ